MAYGNWGAWVYRDGIHQPDMEDRSAYGPDDLPDDHSFWSPTGDNPGTLHAVLGSGPVRLGGYKNYPVLLHDGEVVDLDEFEVDPEVEPGPWDTDSEWSGEVAGYTFRAEQFNDNMVDLVLVEPGGSVWASRCGYCYGAGHDDEPVNECDLSAG